MPKHMIGKLVQSKSRGINASNQVQPSNQQGALAKDADGRPKKIEMNIKSKPVLGSGGIQMNF